MKRVRDETLRDAVAAGDTAAIHAWLARQPGPDVRPWTILLHLAGELDAVDVYRKVLLKHPASPYITRQPPGWEGFDPQLPMHWLSRGKYNIAKAHTMFVSSTLVGSQQFDMTVITQWPQFADGTDTGLILDCLMASSGFDHVWNVVEHLLGNWLRLVPVPCFQACCRWLVVKWWDAPHAIPHDWDRHLVYYVARGCVMDRLVWLLEYLEQWDRAFVTRPLHLVIRGLGYKPTAVHLGAWHRFLMRGYIRHMLPNSESRDDVWGMIDVIGLKMGLVRRALLDVQRRRSRPNAEPADEPQLARMIIEFA